MIDNTGHSIYGASSAKCWRSCHGAPQAVENAKHQGIIPRYPEAEEWTKEGTKAHALAEDILLGRPTDAPIDPEMLDYVTGYTDICEKSIDKANKAGGTWAVEKKVPLWYRPQDQGTIDFYSFIRPDDKVKGGLHIIDFKYGVGQYVEAEENDQQIIYAVSLMKVLEKEGGPLPDEMRVAIGIYQPRHRDFDGGEVWDTTVRELKDYALDIELDYMAASDPDQLTLSPSNETCMFCDLKPVCKARGEKHFSDAPPAVNPLTANPDALTQLTFTPEQIDFICLHGKDMIKVINDVIDGEKDRIKQGGELRGVKLVEGALGRRQWVDEEAAAKLLKPKLGVAECYTKKFLTAPQAAKKLAGMELSSRFKNKLDSLITQNRNAPKLVPIDHKAPAICFNVGDGFDVIENDDELTLEDII